MDFYSRVKNEVKKTKTSLQELVIGLGINHDTYYAQKRAGNLPRADEALKIAKALGVSVEYLVTGEESYSDKSSIKPEIRELLSDLKQLNKNDREMVHAIIQLYKNRKTSNP